MLKQSQVDRVVYLRSATDIEFRYILYIGSTTRFIYDHIRERLINDNSSIKKHILTFQRTINNKSIDVHCYRLLINIDVTHAITSFYNTVLCNIFLFRDDAVDRQKLGIMQSKVQ